MIKMTTLNINDKLKDKTDGTMKTKRRQLAQKRPKYKWQTGKNSELQHKKVKMKRFPEKTNV